MWNKKTLEYTGPSIKKMSKIMFCVLPTLHKNNGVGEILIPVSKD